jgi:uncharacterized protein
MLGSGACEDFYWRSAMSAQGEREDVPPFGDAQPGPVPAYDRASWPETTGVQLFATHDRRAARWLPAAAGRFDPPEFARSPEPHALPIRDADPHDLERILRLNDAHERVLSPLTPARLLRLHEESAYHRVMAVDDAIEGFLLAFRESADYDSPNYLWFRQRYPRFLYIDRIVVDSTAQGHGVGSALYADLAEFARQTGVGLVTCEFDVDPPNESSARFHARLGFKEAGRQKLPGGKTVSLQLLSVGPVA